MDTSITELVRLTGTTSRTLRHYDQIGLLPPTRLGSNGLRYYDRAALRRLQRILLLRQLGLGLPAIAEALEDGRDDLAALEVHLRLLRRQREQMQRRIAAVEATIAALQEGEDIMADQMLDGFDHTAHREEVTERWGAAAYRRSDAWWRGLGEPGRRAFLAESAAIAGEWAEVRAAGLPFGDARVRAIAARHIDWVTAGWGGTAPTAAQLEGLAQMCVADERFAANYGGTQGAEYVRDALLAYLQ